MARQGDLYITQTGEGGVAKAIEAQLGQISQRALVALAIEAHVIMVDAQRRAPLGKTGQLRASAKVEQVQKGRNAGMFKVRFTAPYAKWVHYKKYAKGTIKWRKSNGRRIYVSGERGALIRHPTGEILFLQNAMNYARHGMVSRVANAAKFG